MSKDLFVCTNYIGQYMHLYSAFIIPILYIINQSFNLKFMLHVTMSRILFPCKCYFYLKYFKFNFIFFSAFIWPILFQYFIENFNLKFILYLLLFIIFLSIYNYNI